MKKMSINHPSVGVLCVECQRDRVRGTLCNVYVIMLEKGKNYQIDMKGDGKEDAYPTPLDAYLRLEDEKGRPLDCNDDAPGGYGTSLHAQISFPCKVSGKYRIIATTFDGGTGGYTLQVTIE